MAESRGRGVPIVVVTALLSASGCTDLEAIVRDECGNRVLEPGEDCDTFNAVEGGSCAAPEAVNAAGDLVECRYTCRTQNVQAAEACPAGWFCGADEICRQQSGSFGEALGPWPFGVDEFAIGDVDGDGFADLFGGNQQKLVVRFGAADGQLDESIELFTRQPTGPVTFARFDDDELLDAVVPTNVGLFVALGSDQRSLEPVAYAPFDFGLQVVNVVSIEAFDGGPLVDSFREFLFIQQTPDFGAGTIGSPEGTPLPLTTRGRVTTPIAVANIQGPGAPEEEVAIAVAGASQVDIYEVASASGGLDFNMALLDTVSLGAATVAEGALFADYDGDGDQDLLVSVRVGPARRVAIADNDGAGNLAATATINNADVFNDDRDGAWPLAVVDLHSGNPKPDYVYDDGVFLADFGAVTPPGNPPVALVQVVATDADRVWQDAAVGDFNRDGVLDVAIAAGSPDLDVLLGSPAGLFNQFRVPTDGRVRTSGGCGDLCPSRTVQVGDFDGDFFDDVAFARIDDAGGEDELVVIFAAADATFSEPVSMGRVGTISTVVTSTNRLTAPQLDVTDDLFVISQAPTGVRALAVFDGSSSRRMVSPFTLVDGGDAFVPLVAEVGDFFPAQAPDDVRDIIAITELQTQVDGGDPQANRRPAAWAIPGVGGDGSLDAGAASFFEIPLETQNEFEILCAEWVVEPAPPPAAGQMQAPDLLLGLDGSSDCGVDGGTASSPSLLTVAIDGGTGVPLVSHTSLDSAGQLVAGTALFRLPDLDADGDPDGLALFNGEEDGVGTPIQPSISVLWRDEQLSSVPDHAYQLDLPGLLLQSVRQVHTGEDEYRDLVMLTRPRVGSGGNAEVSAAGLLTLTYDHQQRRFGAPVELFAENRGRLLDVGDINGDGIDDIAYTVSNQVIVRLALPAPPLGGSDEEE